MLIEYKNVVINLKNITSLFKSKVDISITFYVGCENCDSFNFDSLDERDKAFEKIIESYRWQRLHVKLDE